MLLEIPYGKRRVTVEFPERTRVVCPNAVLVKDERETLEHALKNPFGKEKLDEFLAGDEEILFIVNDATRPTPTHRILDVLYPRMEGKKLKFIVATGSHRKPDREEYEYIFGKYYEKFKEAICAHDARDDPMVHLGRTRRGTKIHINKIVARAKKIIVINSVEPHYFAGYTGGRKSILPGVSSYETIEMNHKFALESSSRLLALEGNPVSEDMEEVASHVKNDIFSIMVVLDKEKRIYAACCGDLNQSFREAIRFANDVCMVKIKRKADVVVTVAPHPMDINLYQSQKAMENGRLALKEGGILILVSECGQGIGPQDFFDLLASGRTPHDVMEKIEKGYILGYHKAAKMAELVSKSEAWAVTELPGEEVKKAFIKPYRDIQNALDDALRLREGGDVLILTDGGMIVPCL